MERTKVRDEPVKNVFCRFLVVVCFLSEQLVALCPYVKTLILDCAGGIHERMILHFDLFLLHLFKIFQFLASQHQLHADSMKFSWFRDAFFMFFGSFGRPKTQQGFLFASRPSWLSAALA